MRFKSSILKSQGFPKTNRRVISLAQGQAAAALLRRDESKATLRQYATRDTLSILL